MYISRLKDKLVAYDKYGEHRTNGLKALYALEILLFVEMLSSIPHPYFYYFFVPLTCFNAEIAGNTLHEKYLFLFYSLIGATLSIFLFGVLSVYKTFFIFFVFFYSLFLYYIVIHKLRKMLLVLPFILGLASYSLIYIDQNINFYVALNHALYTLAASAVLFFALFLFPKTYYLNIWRRAFSEVIAHLDSLCASICNEDVKTVGIFRGIVIMERYAKMLPRKTPYYSILKITLLAFELVMSMSYLISFKNQYRIEYVNVLHHYLERLNQACKTREQVVIAQQELPVFRETHELWVLYKLILSWNYLCEKI